MATALPTSALLVTIEKDPVNHAAAVQILDKALGADALDLVPGKGQSSSSSTVVSSADRGLIPPSQSSARVESWEGASGEVLESSAFQKRHGRQPFDLVLMDHWKPEVQSAVSLAHFFFNFASFVSNDITTPSDSLPHANTLTCFAVCD